GSVDDVRWQARSRSVRAKVEARRGHLDAALALSGDAVRLLEGSDGIDVRGDVFMNRAEVLQMADRLEEAIADVNEALALYEQKGNAVSAERAREALDELGGRVPASS